MTSPPRQPRQATAGASHPDEPALAELEAAVQAVTLALVGADAHAIETASARLLSAARSASRVAHARASADTGEARERLARAAAALAAQREAVARAAAAAERAISVLLPSTGDAYGATGTGPRTASTGSLVA